MEDLDDLFSGRWDDDLDELGNVPGCDDRSADRRAHPTLRPAEPNFLQQVMDASSLTSERPPAALQPTTLYCKICQEEGLSRPKPFCNLRALNIHIGRMHKPADVQVFMHETGTALNPLQPAVAPASRILAKREKLRLARHLQRRMWSARLLPGSRSLNSTYFCTNVPLEVEVRS